MRQAFFPKLNELPITRDDIPVPRPADDQVLIKVKMASICNLTDTHTVTGEHPPHNLWAEGYFTNPPNSFPAPIGHEAAGEIVEVGKEVKNLKVGDRVCSVHISDMMSEYAVGHTNVLAKLPSNVTWEEASPIELLNCVYSLVEASVRLGDRVAILGQGASGLISTQLARLRGARDIWVFEPEEHKRSLALKTGASKAYDPRENDPVETIMELSGGQGVDAVIECVGIPETIAITTKVISKMNTRLSGSRGGGTIAIFGACRAHVPFDFMELHFKGGRVHTCGGSPYGYSEFSLARCVDLVASGLFQMKPLLTHIFPLEKTREAFDLLMNKREPAIKVLIDPEAKVVDGQWPVRLKYPVRTPVGVPAR
jgi:L-iditol 2-dehydrogenase